MNDRPTLKSGLPPLSNDRLASLSDTMFGVAMTLLATTLVPDIEHATGSAWEIMKSLREPMSAVVVSFTVSAIYWMSQQRRLSMTKVLAPWQTPLHLLFLFLIVLLPISTGFLVRNGLSATSVEIFGTHLTLIAAGNLALWIGVHRQVDASAALIPATLVLVLLGAALVIGLGRPRLAHYLWYAALMVPLTAQILRRGTQD